MKCLLVDDEPGIRDALAALLRLKGHEVRTAGDRAEALTHLHEQWFDLVISDWRLPDGDAAPLLAASGAPVVVVSGHPDEVVAVPAPLAVLGKPVALPALLALLQQVAAAAAPAQSQPTDLPSDVRIVVDRALALLGQPADAEVWCDGTFVLLRAAVPDGAVPDELAALGGDLRVTTVAGRAVIELRLCRDGRPDPGIPVAGPTRDWPEVAEFAVDFRDTTLPQHEFVRCLDRAAAADRVGRRVHFLNLPAALQHAAVVSGRGNDMPKKDLVGPRLPAVLTELWSER